MQPILDILSDFFSQGFYTVVIELMAIFGWAILAWLLVYILIFFWIKYKEEQYKKKWKWVLLAIDIPPENVQTPKAVEQMFAHLTGAFDEPSLAEKFRQGFDQETFSFEIISIEGYIQFLIRTESKYRDLVEVAIYAQYPDVDITEVEDYVDMVPNRFPNDEYDIKAEDYGLAENDAYPIRSYVEFEHSISKDTVLKDPMGTFLESFTRIGVGEQMWFQIIVKPISNSWKIKSIEKIKELIGDSSAKKKGGALVPLTKEGSKSWEEIFSQLFGSARSEGGGESKPDEPNQMRYLTPGQKIVIEKMEEKIAKIGFKTKMRGVYLARKEVFNSTKGINALRGAINQFNVPSANSLVPTYKASAFYFFAKQRTITRKNLLFNAYKKRKPKTGGNMFVLNIEELATVWHFPMSHVKTPMVQKASLKTAEPPAGLPIETWGDMAGLPLGEEDVGDKINKEPAEESKGRLTDSGEIIQGDDYNLG